MEGNKVVFSVSKMCKDWMNNGEKVLWHKVLWFSQCTPKHSFILWLAILKRLNTQDRLTKWYPGKIMTCPLCEECPDSHEHLFFKCAYSATIWSDLKEKIKMGDISNEWDDVMDKIIRMACNNSIRSIVAKEICFPIIKPHRMKSVKSYKVKASPNIQAVSSEWQITMNNDNSKEMHYEWVWDKLGTDGNYLEESGMVKGEMYSQGGMYILEMLCSFE
ncbi:reverse transcriptase zinc-binding domain-containing protein [Tanacetum coccineum]